MDLSDSSPRKKFSSTSSASSLDQPKNPKEHHRKRAQITVACNQCRRRKIKCDGLRPHCATCSARSIECVYEADPDATPIVALKRKYEQLQRQSEDAGELFDMLKNRPETEALAILKRMRTDEDIHTTLSLVRDGDLLLQRRILSPEGLQNVLPPFSSLTAFELTARFPIAYPPLQRFDVPLAESVAFHRGRSLLLQPQESVGPSKHFSFLPDSDNTTSMAPVPPEERQRNDLRHKNPGILDHYSAHFRRAMKESPLYDERLRYIKASHWTSVVVEDRVFANIISSFLSWDHPPLGLFDEDLFLDDLASGRQEFCSKLLVNAVLAFGSHNYTVVEPAMQTLGSFFFVEAKKLWELEVGRESLACIAASGLLHSLHACRGKDKVGFQYLLQGVRMAKDLGLFRKKSADIVYDVRNPRLRRGRAVVAWGLYNNLVSTFLYMHKDPAFKTPPPVPIPHDASDDEPYWRAYPDGLPRQRSYAARTKKALSELWVIVNDLLPLYYSGDREEIEPESLMEDAKAIYMRLLAWVDALPYQLRRDENAPPHVMILHMHYHSVVMELFRPFVGEAPQAYARKNPSFAAEATIASIEQLQRLIYQYSLRYGGPPVSIFLLSSLLCVAFAALPNLEDPHSKFFFCLCVKFLGDMVQSFEVIRFILQGIYSAVERTGTKLPPEAQIVFDFYDGSLNRVQNIDEVESSYPVDLSMQNTDLEAARLSNLMKSTEALMLNDK